ncbi:Uncharacterised protein [Yersinia mollaretii]|uniref:hypothetical protein n=1 Tax=Yersinia mollaretii TaxID=33060 RepID=UPI0005DE8F31|nr:hypothetical protein [Yersinia mollaretii]CNJ97165.1 Uncharacterised protein [Yersinia mollaretii]
MTKPPPLTEDQKKILSIIEPQLRCCVKTAEFEKAKKLTTQLQKLLRPTGHETRLLQAKNWLYETALEAGYIDFAKSGFQGTMKKSSDRTRIHLEATALLAICFLRESNIDKASKLIMSAVESINNISSEARRKQFHKRLLIRLEEESILAGIVSKHSEPLILDIVDKETIRLVMTQSENQILIGMGSAIPAQSIDLLKKVQEAYLLRLPGPDRKLLPPPLVEEKKEELGKRANSALKRVAWRSLCSPESEVYKAWSGGLSVVYDKKYIASAIVASFNSFSISIVMLAASAAALAIKFCAEVFCETFSPNSLMIEKKDKK